MRSKRWQALVMVAFAWVLWIRSGDDSGYRWNIGDAYVEKRVCEGARLKVAADNAKHKWMTKDTEYMNHYVLRNKKVFREYICLPGTLDPRPRK
jgi:hypothetical protein